MKHKRLKRWLSAFLCVCMVAMMAPCAFAAEGDNTGDDSYAAQVGEQQFATLDEAINAAKAGDTITLLRDFTEYYTSPYDLAGKTLDLNGKTYQLHHEKWFYGDNGTIKNGTINITDKDQKSLTIGGNYSADHFTVDGVTLNNGLIVRIGTDVTLKNLTVETAENNYVSAVAVCKGTSVTIESGRYTAKGMGSAAVHNSGGTLTINGGSFSASGMDARAVWNGFQTDTDNDNTTSTTTINNGNFTMKNDSSSSNWLLYNWSKMTVNGGVFQSESSLLNDNLPGAATDITNGYFDCTSVWASNKLQITGGYYADRVSPSDGYTTVLSELPEYQYKVVQLVNDVKVEAPLSFEANDTKIADEDQIYLLMQMTCSVASLEAAGRSAAQKLSTAQIAELKQAALTNGGSEFEGKTQDDIYLYVNTYIDFAPVSMEDSLLSMELTPMYNIWASTRSDAWSNLFYEDENGRPIDDTCWKVQDAQPLQIDRPTTVKISLPNDFVNSLPSEFVGGSENIHIEHLKNGQKYIYEGTLAQDAVAQSISIQLYAGGYSLSFTSLHGFSPFTVTTELPLATITKDGVTTGYDSLQEAANAAANGDEIVLHRGGRHILNFTETKSVKIKNDSDDDATVVFNGEEKPVTDEQSESFSYTKPTNGGSSSGGSSGGGSGSGTTTYPVTVLSADNGNVNASPSNAAKGKTITITVTPDKGYELATLTAADGSGKAVELTKKSDTTYVFTMPASSVKVSASFAKVKQSFDDVKNDDWFAKAVDYAVDQGMMNGVGGNKFAPDAATTRGMIVTVLYRLEGEPSVGSAAFTDVHDGEYYAKAVAWASANGIVNGYGSGKFGPNDAITREQFAAILYRYAQYKGYDVSVGESTNILSYADAQSVSEYAVPALQWACGAGVMNGANGKLLPKANATRAQAAQLLMNFCESAVK